MKNLVKQSIKGTCAIVLSFMVLSGCVSIKASKTNNLPSNARLLVLPPHDVVQGGLPHPVGKGSGKQLQKSIIRELNIMSDFEVIAFEANDTINYTTEINKEDAITESQRLGVDYYLLLTLGEFRNAAPMTYRTDFVTLQDGILIDVKKNEEIWSLDRPLVLDKGNFGDHYGLIDSIAKEVVRSIVTH